MQLKTYKPLERNMYLVGILGQNIIFNIISVYVSYYMQSVLFLPAAVIGTVPVLAQVWDAFNDPIMGTIVDRTRTKWGKCRPYLLFVPAINAVVTMLCFLCIPYDPSAGAFSLHNVLVVLWAGGAYVLWGMTYTAGDIPLWGISALMTEDEKDRQKLHAGARVFAGIGAGVAMLGFQPMALNVGNMLVDSGYDQAKAARMGFVLVAAAFIVVGAAAFQMAGLFSREKIAPSKKENKVLDNFKMMWRNKPFRQLLISGFLTGPRNLTTLIAFNLVTYYFAGKDGTMNMLYLVLVGGGTFGGMMIVTAFVPKILTRVSKRNVYIGANLMEVIPDVVLFVLFLVSVNVPGGLTALPLLIPCMIIFTIKGIGLGLFSAVQTVMIADAVDYEDYTNNLRPDAVFYSGQTLIVKIGNGISQTLYGLLCGLVMFSGTNVQLMQGLLDKALKNPDLLPRNLMEKGSQAVVFASEIGSLTADQLYGFLAMMFFAISIIPAIASIAGAIPMFKYDLTPEKYDEVLSALQKRRREEGGLVE